MNRGNLRAWANYRYPHRAAYIFGEKRLTFGEMLARSGKVANGLRSIGLRQGQKMAVDLSARKDADKRGEERLKPNRLTKISLSLR